MACLNETPIESGVDGSVCGRFCKRCKRSTRHVIRPIDFKIEAFQTKAQMRQIPPIQFLIS